MMTDSTDKTQTETPVQSHRPPWMPETAFYGDDGKLYHTVERMTEGGTSVKETRRLASSIEEARDNRIDFFHPTYGLIWEGFKLASDRRPQEILNDGSTGGLVPANRSQPGSK